MLWFLFSLLLISIAVSNMLVARNHKKDPSLAKRQQALKLAGKLGDEDRICDCNDIEFNSSGDPWDITDPSRPYRDDD